MSTPRRRTSSPPRYSNRPLPPYRHLPGETPHPERDPAGHMFECAEAVPEDWSAEGWRENELYLYGVDLFNLGYWWEAHAAWEALWQTTGRSDAAGRFLQGLIQIAAALVQHRAGREGGARRLVSRGLAKLRTVPEALGQASGERATVFMGVDVEAFVAVSENLLVFAGHERDDPPILVLL